MNPRPRYVHRINMRRKAVVGVSHVVAYILDAVNDSLVVVRGFRENDVHPERPEVAKRHWVILVKKPDFTHLSTPAFRYRSQSSMGVGRAPSS